jgi:hypothetical protein
MADTCSAYGHLVLDPEQHSIKIRNSAGFMVAQVHQYSNGVGPARKDCKRMAALFVAAPELFDALASIMELMPQSQDRPSMMSIGQWNKARRALARCSSQVEQTNE